MMRTNEHQTQLQQQHFQRKLEDILADPNANWSDIRSVMKVSGACTNAALMRAISSSNGAEGVAIPGAVSPAAPVKVENHVMPSSPEVPTSAPINKLVPQVDDDDLSEYDSDEFEVLVVSTFQAPFAQDRAQVASSSNIRRESVNIMDFGVNNFAVEHEDELVKTGGALRERRDSVASALSTDCEGFMGWVPMGGLSKDQCRDSFCSVGSALSVDSAGFLGWKSDGRRRSSRSSYTVDSEGFLGWDRENDFRKIVDSEGFMTWEHSKRARNAKAPKTENIANVLGVDFESEPWRHDWNIDDYENPMDDDPTVGSSSRDSMGSLDLLLSIVTGSVKSRREHKKDSAWKMYAPSKRTQEASEHAKLHDVCQALMNVRQKSQNRRCTIETETPVKPVEAEASKLSKLLKRDSAQFTSKFHGEKGKNQDTRPLALFANADSEDTRAAIWIKRCDGDVDIAKECRKLYLGESEEQLQKQGSGKRAGLLQHASSRLSCFRQEER